jgi:hypothetical protein
VATPRAPQEGCQQGCFIEFSEGSLAKNLALFFEDLSKHVQPNHRNGLRASPAHAWRRVFEKSLPLRSRGDSSVESSSEGIGDTC